MQAHVIFISILIGVFLQTICILMVNYTKFRKCQLLKTLVAYTTPTILTTNIITLGITFNGIAGLIVGICLSIATTFLIYLLLVHFDEN
jgi:hypothetical protein